MSPEISISKWGNSQGLRIPKEIINALKLNIGDKVRIVIENNRAVIEPVKPKKSYSIEDLVANIPKDYQKEPEYLTTPMGREVW